MTYFYVADFDWDPGTVIDNDTLSESPQKTFFTDDVPAHLEGEPDYLVRRQAEGHLEESRLAKFPGLPSRRNAIFLNRDLQAATKWTEMPARHNRRIYELEEMEREASTDANFLWYNYMVRLCRDPEAEFRRIFSDRLDEEINRVAQAYWRNDESEPWGESSRTEVLFIGRLKVVRRVA